MFQRKTEGSILCPSCRQLVGVRDERCFHCGRPNPGMWGFGSLISSLGAGVDFVALIIWPCVALYLCTLVVDVRGIQTSGLNLLSPSLGSLFLFGASGAVPVFVAGRWWTVLSAIWLHGGLLHIGFNMWWVRDLGPAAAHLYGTSRAVIIYTLAGIAGFVASSFAGAYLGFLPGMLQGGRFTIGASASIMGLLGAMAHYGRRSGSHVIGSTAKRWAAILILFGFMIPGVDNWAHLGGFAGGYLASTWLDPLRPERPDHVLGALACLFLSVVAVVASVVLGLPYFR